MVALPITQTPLHVVERTAALYIVDPQPRIEIPARKTAAPDPRTLQLMVLKLRSLKLGDALHFEDYCVCYAAPVHGHRYYAIVGTMFTYKYDVPTADDFTDAWRQVAQWLVADGKLPDDARRIENDDTALRLSNVDGDDAKPRMMHLIPKPKKAPRGRRKHVDLMSVAGL